MLSSRYMQRHLPNLYSTATDLLHHLAPDAGRIEDDQRNILETQKPDSVFNEDFRDFDELFNVHLAKYRSSHQQYIRIRAVHRACLGPDRDPTSMRSGIDLVVYLANLAVFAKQLIPSDRREKAVFDALRQLDSYQFPQLFLSALRKDKEANTATGESGLAKMTFNLALELRVHLAILVMERRASEGDFNPEVVLEEVFFGDDRSADIRGWDVSGLGGSDGVLPSELHGTVIKQITEIRQSFSTDTGALQRGEFVDFDRLKAAFPWDSIVLQLIEWVRWRHREIQTAIKRMGGVKDISRRLQLEIEQAADVEVTVVSIPQADVEVSAASIPQAQARTSFGRHRRSGGRKSDLRAPEQNEGIDILATKKKRVARLPPAESTHSARPVEVSRQATEPLEAPQQSTKPHWSADLDWQPPSDDEEPVEIQEALRAPPKLVPTQNIHGQSVAAAHTERLQAEEAATGEPSASAPPSPTPNYEKIRQKLREADKENRGRGYRAPRPNAKQNEFEDGFEGSRPTPGPSHKGKEPQRSPAKRPRPEDDDDDSDEDAFETGNRDARASERRRTAPVAKKARIDQSQRTGITSSAPTSYQRPRIDADEIYEPHAEQESLSEGDPPEMTEEAPPASSFTAVRQLARINGRAGAMGRARRAPGRRGWTEEAEQAFIEYMERYPRAYSEILEYDSRDGYNILQDRSQVNLKDKARNMAFVMIK
jgi:hypothetical protein